MRIEAGSLKGRALPEVTDARPVGARVKKSLFSVLQPRLPGARVLDLFAGVGGLGLEALSRGAEDLVLVDRDPRAVRALTAWLERAGVGGSARALRLDLPRQAAPAGPFDLVFVDPPFELWEGEAARALLALAVERLREDGLVVLKVPASALIPEDEAWQEVRRKRIGAVAWVLVEATSPAPAAGEN
jgi:16S rRNA (guanine966-N2)-methyltransferase